MSGEECSSVSTGTKHHKREIESGLAKAGRAWPAAPPARFPRQPGVEGLLSPLIREHQMDHQVGIRNHPMGRSDQIRKPQPERIAGPQVIAATRLTSADISPYNH